MSNLIEIKVPDIGEFTDVPVIEILVSAGEHVEAEQSLLTLESDKATMEVPSPAAGVIAQLRVKLDDTVSEDDVLAVLEADEVGSDEAGSEAPQAPEAEKAKAAEAPIAEKKPAPAIPPAATLRPAAAGPGAGQRSSPPVSVGIDTTLPGRIPYASPAVRMYARELGVDLFRVTGTGRSQRILKEDVTAFVKSAMSAPPAPAPGLGFDIAPPPRMLATLAQAMSNTSVIMPVRKVARSATRLRVPA